MPGVAGGRYCALCTNVVVDFTAMTDAQLIDWMRNHRGGCGTFRRDQLNRDLIEPVVRTAPFGMNWLLSLLIFTGCIRGDGSRQAKPASPVTEQQPPHVSCTDDPPAADSLSPAAGRERHRNGQSVPVPAEPEIYTEVTGGVPVWSGPTPAADMPKPATAAADTGFVDGILRVDSVQHESGQRRSLCQRIGLHR